MIYRNTKFHAPGFSGSLTGLHPLDPVLSIDFAGLQACKKLLLQNLQFFNISYYTDLWPGDMPS
jgi:hypothetical protein